MSELYFIKILLLSIVQGISEFIPVSSSGLLVIFENIFEIQNNNLLINVTMHGGSLAAVVLFFYKDLVNLWKNPKLLLNLIIATIPVVIVGGFLQYYGIVDQLMNIVVIGYSTIFFGILLFFSDRNSEDKKFNQSISNKDSFIIGLYQVLALIPGTSRSGITLTGARFLKFNRVDAARFSFLLSIPTLSAAFILSTYKIYKLDETEFNTLLLLAFVFSFVFSLLTIKYFLIFLKNFSLNVFVVFRIIMGLGLLTFYYTTR
ncbi:MAG: undecaprenyl-diphosphate phosphatase [Proteobacteria bacterium]|jgi:undecaprenyl-diphosphatase|nr:undecaprenyl-diphosphate phosphatase [Pseudomonadota bacterium]